MEYYVVANKDKTAFLTWVSGSCSNYRDFRECPITDAIVFDDIETARFYLADTIGNRLNGNINNYQIIRVRTEIVKEGISPITNEFVMEYTTSQNEDEITREDIASMLNFKYGIVDKAFDYKLTLLNKRNRTHIAKVKITFKD